MTAAKFVLFAFAVLLGQAVAQPITIGFLMEATGPEGTVMEVCAGILSGTTSGRVITLNYFTRDNTAVENEDYTPTSGTLTFDDTTTVPQCVSVATLQDNIEEDFECFAVEISRVNLPAQVTVLPFDVAVCITDDDGPTTPTPTTQPPTTQPPIPTIQPQFPAYTVNEGAGTLTICVVASDVTSATSVSYSTRDNQAVGGQDYMAANGFLMFSPMVTSLCVTITIADDVMVESQECFDFVLQAPMGEIVTPVCINDNDSPVSRVVGFEPGSYTVDENVSPTANFQVCVVLRQGVLTGAEEIRLDLTLVQGTGGTAELDLDYRQVDPNPFPLVFDFNNQDQALCAPVDIVDNLVFEPDETFYAVITTSATNVLPVTLSPSTARITIRDDEMEPEQPTFNGPSVGDDPHFAIFLQSGKLLCYTVQGEHGFAFNLISNEKIHMNAMFVPDSHREEVTWIGSLGIVVKNTHFQGSNTTRIRFESKVNEIHINDKVTLEAKNIDMITFHDGKLLISEGPMAEGFRYPSVRVNLDDMGMSFTVNFTGEHLDMMWNKLQENEDSHGLIGQFFRKGVEIDVAKKLLQLPGKRPVPVMRKPVWAYMEHNVPSNQLCWVAMNPGYQGNHLIDGHYLDYVVDNILSTNFKFECKHMHLKNHY